MNTKTILLILAIIVIATVAYFMLREQEVAPSSADKLTITETVWVGERPTGAPTATPKQFEELVQKGKKMVFKGLSSSESYTLTIKQIYKNRLTLEIHDLYLKAGKDLEKPGINLNQCKKTQDFEIERGEHVELSTCSMDAGVTWVIQYGKVGAKP